MLVGLHDMIGGHMLADVQTWQFPVVVLEFLVILGAIGGAIYFFVKWSGRK